MNNPAPVPSPGKLRGCNTKGIQHKTWRLQGLCQRHFSVGLASKPRWHCRQFLCPMQQWNPKPRKNVIKVYAIQVFPYSYDKQEVGDPRTTTAKHCTKAMHCVYRGDKPVKLQNGWVFRGSTWNVNSITSRTGDAVKVLGDEVEVGCISRWQVGCHLMIPKIKSPNCKICCTYIELIWNGLHFNNCLLPLLLASCGKMMTGHP